MKNSSSLTGGKTKNHLMSEKDPSFLLRVSNFSLVPRQDERDQLYVDTFGQLNLLINQYFSEYEDNNRPYMAHYKTHLATTFLEAIQSQWFTQVGFRFEQMHGGTVGNGRIDQYLYPYYKNDLESGRVTDDDVLELLEHLWLNLAQNVTLQQ